MKNHQLYKYGSFVFNLNQAHRYIEKFVVCEARKDVKIKTIETPSTEFPGLQAYLLKASRPQNLDISVSTNKFESRPLY